MAEVEDKSPIWVYLDDTRPTPEGWVGVRWPEQVIELLQTKRVNIISLDHDLGETGDNARTGMDVLLWLEKAVFHNPLMHLPEINIHTANPVARNRMHAAARKIHSLSAPGA